MKGRGRSKMSFKLKCRQSLNKKISKLIKLDFNPASLKMNFNPEIHRRISLK